jgi:IclR family KDG regulon transcriptional repressor
MEQNPVKTIQKTFKVLEILSEKQPAKPSELLQESRLQRSNLYRILGTLIDLGYVEKDSDSRYCLSFKMFKIGNTVRGMNRLCRVAQPYMAPLAEMSEETINLAILYDHRVLYIDKIESKHYLRLDQPIGKTDPLHCTALGKILLSGLDDLELEVFLRSKNLIPYTRNTITDPEVLKGVIRNVKRQGYAIDTEELSYGIHCIASRICDHSNRVIAAISISGPAVRLTKEKMEELRIPLMTNAAQISRKMGCTDFGTPESL